MLARVLDAGREAVLVTLRRQCSRRMLAWCAERNVPVYDMVLDLEAMAGRRTREEVEAAYQLPDPREVSGEAGRQIPGYALRAAMRLSAVQTEERDTGTPAVPLLVPKLRGGDAVAPSRVEDLAQAWGAGGGNSE